MLQHESFLAANLLIWWVVLEPQHMRLPADLWKIGYVFAARMASIMMGMAIVMTRSPIYAGFYGDRPREHGLAPLADQQIGGRADDERRRADDHGGVRVPVLEGVGGGGRDAGRSPEAPPPAVSAGAGRA